jgi:hypothetical protein
VEPPVDDQENEVVDNEAHDDVQHLPPVLHLDVDLPIATRKSKSNSNSLSNQLGIHLILAKQEKLASNSLAKQLGKNRNLGKLTSPRVYMRARIVVAIGFPSRWEGEKNKE